MKHQVGILGRSQCILVHGEYGDGSTQSSYHFPGGWASTTTSSLTRHLLPCHLSISPLWFCINLSHIRIPVEMSNELGPRDPGTPMNSRSRFSAPVNPRFPAARTASKTAGLVPVEDGHHTLEWWDCPGGTMLHRAMPLNPLVHYES